MPWNWQRSSPETSEAANHRTWPDYEAEYLKRSLENGYGKYGDAPNDVEGRLVYLNKVSEDFRKDADASLKNEFNLWLQGSHEDNVAMRTYRNQPGKPHRQHVYRGQGADEVPGESKDDWVPTWWGQKQLTHLPGVREYLRAQKTAAVQQELELNMLAEHGPQDIETAWQYFKHWVKGRPREPPLMNRSRFEPGTRSDVQTQPPGDMNREPPPPPSPPELEDLFGSPPSSPDSSRPPSPRPLSPSPAAPPPDDVDDDDPELLQWPPRMRLPGPPPTMRLTGPAPTPFPLLRSPQTLLPSPQTPFPLLPSSQTPLSLRQSRVQLLVPPATPTESRTQAEIGTPRQLTYDNATPPATVQAPREQILQRITEATQALEGLTQNAPAQFSPDAPYVPYGAAVRQARRPATRSQTATQDRPVTRSQTATLPQQDQARIAGEVEQARALQAAERRRASNAPQRPTTNARRIARQRLQREGRGQ